MKLVGVGLVYPGVICPLDDEGWANDTGQIVSGDVASP